VPERFLQPSLDQLHDRFLLHGMEAAVARLLAARDRPREDRHRRRLRRGRRHRHGHPARGARELRMRCGADRCRTGCATGMAFSRSMSSAAEGCSVILTVDCGSSSITAVEEAQGSRPRCGGHRTITFRACELPAGTVHINPRQQVCCYPFRELAAAGLALKLALAFASRCGKELDPARLCCASPAWGRSPTWCRCTVRTG
jgi:single-stranded-DNA-specific exonuclease